jgi:hypothetical protein
MLLCKKRCGVFQFDSMPSVFMRLRRVDISTPKTAAATSVSGKFVFNTLNLAKYRLRSLGPSQLVLFGWE